jgi:hypothetical protein
MPNGTPPELQLLGSVAGIAKDLTLTTFLLWILFMMMTGRLIRREELDSANKRTEQAEMKSDWWRDKFLGVIDTTRESISTLKTTVEAGLSALRSGNTKLR